MSGGELRAAVADWLQIVTAPITFAGLYGVWHVQNSRTNLTQKQVIAFLIVLTITVWVLLFSCSWRISLRLLDHVRKSKYGTATLLSFICVGTGSFLLIAIQLYVTEAMGRNRDPLEQLLWIALPAATWLGANLFLFFAHAVDNI